LETKQAIQFSYDYLVENRGGLKGDPYTPGGMNGLSPIWKRPTSGNTRKTDPPMTIWTNE